MSAYKRVTGRRLAAGISLALLAAVGWFLFLKDSWADSSIYVSSYSLSSYLAMMCAAYILVEYRIREETEQTVFHAALFFVSIVSMIKASRIILQQGPLHALSLEMLSMLADLCIFGVILLISVVRRKQGGPNQRGFEVVALVLAGLFVQLVAFVAFNYVPPSAHPILGAVMGIFAATTVTTSGFLWLRIGATQRMFDTTTLIVGFLTYGVSWIPLVYSLYQPSILWTLAFSLRGIGLVFLVVSTALPFFQRSGSPRSAAYLGILGLQAVAILPLFITETVSGFFPEGASLGSGVHVIVHLGAAILAIFIAVLTSVYNSQRFEIRRYPLIVAFLVWASLDIYQIVITLVPSLGLSTASLAPYASAILLTGLLLPLSMRWTSSEPPKWIIDNRRILIVMTIFCFFFGVWIGEAYSIWFLTLPSFPYARIFILATLVFIVFAFVYSLSAQLRVSKGRPSVDLLSIGFLLPWIVPTLIRASYGEMSIGWGLADLLLLMTLLVGPVVLGAIYLEEMQRAEEQKKRAQLYADLLVHDITNYHQALEIGFGLISLDDTDPSIQKRAVEASYAELERADRLIKDVRRLSMAEEFTPAALHEIDLTVILDAAFSIACRRLDTHGVALEKLNPHGEFHALGSNLLIDAVASVLEDIIIHKANQEPITADIRDSDSQGKGFWELTLSACLRDSSPFKAGRPEDMTANQGLGPSVASSIVEALGGTLRISQPNESDDIHRTSVTFTLRKA